MAREDLERVLDLHERGYFRSPDRKIVELGAQQMSNNLRRSKDLFDRAAAQFGVEPRLFGPPPPPPPPSGIESLPRDAPFTKEMWEWLGFSYVAFDFDDSEHSIGIDLNFDDAPEELRGKFDLVTNLGTTEHVANQVQAMKVIHDLAGIGGVMMHNLPAQGHETHGLVNYTPKFFWRLSRSNDYRWVEIDFHIGPPHVLSTDLIEDVGRYHSEAAKAVLEARQVSDSDLVAIVMKQHDRPYVPPVDVEPGPTGNKRARERYPTIFTAPDEEGPDEDLDAADDE